MLNAKSDPYAPIKDRFCSICGKQLCLFDTQENLILQRRFGYGSAFDEQEHRVEFCCDCFDNLLKSCKRPTLIKDWNEKHDDDDIGEDENNW